MPRRRSLKNILKQAPAIPVCDQKARNSHDAVIIARVSSVKAEGRRISIPGRLLDEFFVINSKRPGQHGYADTQFFVKHLSGTAELGVNKLVILGRRQPPLLSFEIRVPVGVRLNVKESGGLQRA